GNNEKEKALYEFNAKDLITLWGDKNCPLHEYANRQWSGLLNDFYKPRWQQFFSILQQSLQTGKVPDFTAFEKEISQWEWHWVKEHKSFPVEASGNSSTVALAMYKSTGR